MIKYTENLDPNDALKKLSPLVVGKTIGEVVGQLQQVGWSWRITMHNMEGRMVTMDYKQNRLNFWTRGSGQNEYEYRIEKIDSIQ